MIHDRSILRNFESERNPRNSHLQSLHRMSVIAQNDGEREPNLPLVLLHSLPTFYLRLGDRILSNFRLLDPRSSPEPTHSFIARHSPSIRALICVGPTPLPSDTLHLLPALELVVCSSAGIDHVDVAECRRRGISVTNAGSAFAEDAADYAVALLIDVLRRLSEGDRYVRSGLWPVNGDFPLGSTVNRKQVGIIGLGRIGSEIAVRLQAFGCNIAYTSRTKKESIPYKYHGNVCDLAANADVLIICCALTKQTFHIVDEVVIKALGKEGVIINVGRGGLVDEKALVRALKDREIKGAGFDVFENEPNVPPQLLEMDNVVLSPHRAVLTPESLDAVVDVVLGNLEAFFSNRPLLSAVQLE